MRVIPALKKLNRKFSVKSLKFIKKTSVLEVFLMRREKANYEFLPQHHLQKFWQFFQYSGFWPSHQRFPYIRLADDKAGRARHAQQSFLLSSRKYNPHQ